jgi:hypothetical protein
MRDFCDLKYNFISITRPEKKNKKKHLHAYIYFPTCNSPTEIILEITEVFDHQIQISTIEIYTV